MPISPPANANMTASATLGYGTNSLPFQVWEVPVGDKGYNRIALQMNGVAIPVFYVDSRKS